MIRFLYADNLAAYPDLEHAMFADRAAQFRDRLKWDVCVNAAGEERDEFDRCNPIYVIWQTPDGGHGGSIRFLPTTGPTMLAEHFPQMTGLEQITSPYVWECTRFCLSPEQKMPSRVATGLLLAASRFGLALQIDAAVAIYDTKMKRVYKSLGWVPETLATSGQGSNALALGVWHFSEAICPTLSDACGVPVQFIDASIQTGLKDLVRTV